jgi:hypothetical protein
MPHERQREASPSYIVLTETAEQLIAIIIAWLIEIPAFAEHAVQALLERVLREEPAVAAVEMNPVLAENAAVEKDRHAMEQGFPDKAAVSFHPGSNEQAPAPGQISKKGPAFIGIVNSSLTAPFKGEVMVFSDRFEIFLCHPAVTCH